MYCSIEELKKRYRSSFIDSAEADKVNQALLDADTLIDTYIKNQVKLPITEVPVIITRIAADLALYFITTSNGHSGDGTDETSQLWKKSISLLNDISTGKINPFESTSEEQQESLWIVKKNPPEFY